MWTDSFTNRKYLNQIYAGTRCYIDITTCFRQMSGGTRYYIDITTCFQKIYASTRCYIDITICFQQISGGTRYYKDIATCFQQIYAGTSCYIGITTCFQGKKPSHLKFSWCFERFIIFSRIFEIFFEIITFEISWNIYGFTNLWLAITSWGIK